MSESGQWFRGFGLPARRAGPADWRLGVRRCLDDGN
jgi:hypothetical protein